MEEKEVKKLYTGTKTIKAAPMTMGEAYERKLLKEGVRPSECETDKAGYLVEYEGGYQSWSPAEPFERAYRPSETFLDRLRIERDEVKTRFEGLQRYLANKGFDTIADQVGAHQAALLLMQHTFMKEYVNILEVRIEDIEKDLSKDSQTERMLDKMKRKGDRR